jgi:hypothetical protein
MEGLLTHVATADCFMTLPHPALECGIVTAWWQSEVEGDPAMPRGTRTSNGSGNRDPYSVSDQTRRGLET